MTVKEFGISLNFTDGTNINIDNSNDKLTLLKSNETYDGIYSVYEHEGTWISNVIDLVDKYTNLGNLAITSSVYSGQSYKAYTRTSDDSQLWSEYIEIDYSTGKMQSSPKRYIQIKIELQSTPTSYKESALEFNNVDEYLSGNDYVTTQNGSLELKKNYNFEMTDDNGDNIYKTTILSSKFKKIDRIRLKVNGVEI